MRYQVTGLLCIMMGLSACASGTVPSSPEETTIRWSNPADRTTNPDCDDP